MTATAHPWPTRPRLTELQFAVEPVEAAADADGVVLGDVPECDPSDGVLTGGGWTGRVVVDGVLSEGVVRPGVLSVGVLTVGVLTAGVVIGPTVTGGTVAVGVVRDGAVTEGSDTVGVVTVGTPSAPASAARIAKTTSAMHVMATAMGGRLMSLPSGRRTTYQRTRASTLHTDRTSGKPGTGAYTTRAAD